MNVFQPQPNTHVLLCYFVSSKRRTKIIDYFFHLLLFLPFKIDFMRFLITCPFGLSSVLWNELKRLKINPEDSFATGAYATGELKELMQINLRSRIANKVYLQVAYGPCADFDALFALVQTVDWTQYVSVGQAVAVNIHTNKSQLTSERTLQSITNKAIYQQLNPTGGWRLDREATDVEVFVMIANDQATIFVNSSGRSLYQRWYRSETWDAPLKENIAAGLILSSGWKYANMLRDPCCGSGTLPIEAAMIARNIAPGLQRRFAFENRKTHDSQLFSELQRQAIDAQFTNKMYQISASDIDADMIHLAQENAKRAGVADTIKFFQHDLLSPLTPFDLDTVTIISNPPYGKRLAPMDLDKIYAHLISLVGHGRGGFISSYGQCKDMLDSSWANKKLFNGADECIFWTRK